MSENKMIPFIYDESPVRVIQDADGNPLWVAKDVAIALGYVWHRGLFNHVPNEWMGVNPIDTLGGLQEMITLSEQGLYFFLGRSDKPSALPFQKWIAGDVIPSLRKTGSYTLKNKQTDTNTLPLAEILAIFSRLLSLIERLEQRLPVSGRKKQTDKDKVATDCEERVIDSSSLYVRDFVNDCCELLPRTWDARTRMFDAYKIYCERVGCSRPLGRNHFLQTLSKEVSTVKPHRGSTSDGSQPSGFANIRLNAQGNVLADLCKKKEQAENG